MEMEDNQQQMHEGAPTLSPRRQRRMNEESAVAVMSESEKSEERYASINMYYLFDS